MDSSAYRIIFSHAQRRHISIAENCHLRATRCANQANALVEQAPFARKIRLRVGRYMQIDFCSLLMLNQLRMLGRKTVCTSFLSMEVAALVCKGVTVIKSHYWCDCWCTVIVYNRNRNDSTGCDGFGRKNLFSSKKSNARGCDKFRKKNLFQRELILRELLFWENLF